MYLKYYNSPYSSHYFSGLGTEIGYEFEFLSLESLLNKIKGMGPTKKIEENIVKYLDTQVGKKLNTGAKGYVEIAVIKDKTLTNFMNPTEIWIKFWKRPKGK